jgi:hypothetical protein
MITYKVCCMNHSSGKLLSSHMMVRLSSFCLEYYIGVRTTPKIGAIFSFKEAIQAFEFIRSCRDNDYKILECHSELYDIQHDFCAVIYGATPNKDIEYFWNNPVVSPYESNNNSVYSYNFAGTVLCKSVLPIRILSYKDVVRMTV